MVDETLTDFLSLWNPWVLSLRRSVPWIPLPTFDFELWLGGLILAVVVLGALSRFAFRGDRWLRPLSYALSLVMVGNGLVHLAASAYLGRPAPGVLSSPLLLLSGGYLLVATRALEAEG
ncbi:MAG: hypothetical protein OEW05_00865 [Candidatus Aminicenantes bacterium]|nr:hypothetical protein [Candidatus Aminicenantes bacterium]